MDDVWVEAGSDSQVGTGVPGRAGGELLGLVWEREGLGSRAALSGGLTMDQSTFQVREEK